MNEIDKVYVFAKTCKENEGNDELSQAIKRSKQERHKAQMKHSQVFTHFF